MIKDKSNKLLSDIVAFRTYANFMPHLNRRETLEETINRDMIMHLKKFPKLSPDIIKAFKQVHELKVMPSMRSLQFGGRAIETNNLRIFNCSFVAPDYARVFAEIAFILLSGTGAGSTVSKEHISKLPQVRNPKEEGEYLIHDSIEGWAKAFEELTGAYFYGGIRPLFNYTRIRLKGALLHTTGAKAPGPEPLKHALELVETYLKKAVGRKLTSLEVFDIICIISDCVVSGGIRRAALIILFDRDDEEMLKAKHGQWYIDYPWRARANISAILPRNKVKKKEFERVYQACIDSNCGEPGFFFTNDNSYGVNPCAEISLRHLPGDGSGSGGGLCNLSVVNLTGVKDKRDLRNRVYAAALIGTLQASYTDFPYLNDKWKENAEDEALLGVSMTGICDNELLDEETLKEMAELVKEVNTKYAAKIGIKPAKRLTCVKPDGTSSIVLGSSSGIHARHSKYYLRRVRMGDQDALAKYLMTVIPDLVEVDRSSKNSVVVTIPQKSPENSVTRENESAKAMLERVMHYNKHWVGNGHVEGANRHNVSCTINFQENEIEYLKEELWNNRDNYSGISLLPYDGGTYVQAPFEECTEEVYLELMEKVREIDLTKVLEFDDNTSHRENVACAAGACEIDFSKPKAA